MLQSKRWVESFLKCLSRELNFHNAAGTICLQAIQHRKALVNIRKTFYFFSFFLRNLMVCLHCSSWCLWMMVSTVRTGLYLKPVRTGWGRQAGTVLWYEGDQWTAAAFHCCQRTVLLLSKKGLTITEPVPNTLASVVLVATHSVTIWEQIWSRNNAE